MPIGLCPSCDSNVPFDERPELGRRATCPVCGAKLVVVDVDPLELDWAPSEFREHPAEEDT